MNRIYLDNAATTRISSAVLQAMMPYLTEVYGNPSAIYVTGREAHGAIEKARAQVASALGAESSEIYFTSGGTESDNWALRGGAYARRKKGAHLITSSIEHHAVLHTMEQLAKEGFEVTFLPVDDQGMVSPESVEKAIRSDTTLISVMMANNEVGTVEPIREIASIAKEHGILMHTDAVQAVGAIPIDVKTLPVDLLSLSGHKFHAPKGVGALYVRKGTVIERFIRGGSQERGQRAGTENIASIVGLGAAITRATADIPARSEYLTGLRETLIRKIMETIPEVRLNGHPTQRLPGNVNVSIHHIEGKSLLLNLDMEGIAASSGSACTAGSLDPSHVLLAMGLSHELANSSLRFTMSEDNTVEEIIETVEILQKITVRLRNMTSFHRE